MFCRHVFGNISGGFRGISCFFGNNFRGISGKYLNFAGLRPHEISEALLTAGKKLICLDKESLEIQAKAVILF